MVYFWIQRANSDLSLGGEANKQMLAGTADSGSQLVSYNLTTFQQKNHYFFTNALVPKNSDWETGDFTVYFNYISVSGDQVLAYVYMHRVNSAGVIQESTDYGFRELTNGSQSITIPSKDWSAGNVGDRMCLQFKILNFSDYPRNVSFYIGSAGIYLKSDNIIIYEDVLIEGTINAVSSIAAAELNGFIQYLESNINASSSTTAALNFIVPISTVINAVSNSQASAIDNQPYLYGTIDAQSDITAVIQYYSYLEGSVTSISSISDSSLVSSIGLETAINAVSDVGVFLTEILSFETEIVASSSAISILDTQQALSAVINAVSNVDDTAFDIQFEPETIINSVSDIANSVLDVQQGFISTIESISGVSANLTVTISLEGTVDSSSTVEASESTIVSLESSITANSSVSDATLSFVDMLEIWRSVNGGSYEFLAFVPFANPYYDDYNDLVRYSDYCYIARKIVDQIPHAWSNIDCQIYSTGTLNFSTVITPISNVSAELTIVKLIESDITAISTVDAVFSITQSLESIIDSESSISASLSIFNPLESVINAISDVSCDIEIIRSITSSIISESIITSEILITRSIESQIVAISSVESSLITEYAISTEVSSVSDVSASLAVTKTLEAVINAESSIEASFNYEFTPLNAVINAVSDVIGEFEVEQLVASIIGFESVSTADLTVTYALDSQINAVSSVDSWLNLIIPISTTINAVSTIDTFLYLIRNIDATVNSISAIDATIISEFALSSLIESESNIASSLISLLSFETTVEAESSLNDSVLGITLVFETVVNAISYINSDELYKDVTGKECVCADSTITKLLEFSSLIEIVEYTSTITVLVEELSTITRTPEEISTITKIVEEESVIPNVGRSLC